MSEFKLNWDYPGYIVYQQLIDTRPWWNEELVDRYLTVPDRMEVNPHNHSQLMRLFYLDRVKRIEHDPYFRKEILLPKDFSRFESMWKKFVRFENNCNKNRRLRMKRNLVKGAS